MKFILAVLATAYSLTAQISISTGPTNLTALTFSGVNYNYASPIIAQITTTTPAGVSSASSPTCKGVATATTITFTNCKTTGSDTITLAATFSTPAALATVATGATYGTVQADIQFTNNSKTDTVSKALLSLFGVASAQYNAKLSNINPVNSLSPIAYANYGAGQWAMWVDTVNPNVAVQVLCGWSYICKNQPSLSNIGPGQTVSASFSIRFTTDTTATMINLAPEAYMDFAAAYPQVLNWPDRRPIVNWFIADTGHQSATNPRGYLWNPALDVTNIPNFTSQLLGQAQALLKNIQSRPVQPQGVVVWDLEGEEFIQATTYVGDPRVFDAGYSPEMQATADQLFALFRNAGLKVGMTLRPQSLKWGTVQPATCQYNANNNYKDYFINVAAPFLQKFFGCYDPAGIAWSLIPKGNGGQTFFQPNSNAQEIALLLAKAQYANTRWGATIFYVDTTVWVGGGAIDQSIFRALDAALPGCLFIPEESSLGNMAVAMPYSDPNSTGPKYAPASWRYAYPAGAQATYLTNCQNTCWSTNVGNFEIGQMIGDIAIYAIPQMSAVQLTTIESMILAARTAAGSVTVTDSSTGKVHAFTGTPATAYKYPLKMRVYFGTQTNLTSSSTYCEAGGWTGTTACTLNLAGLSQSQVRYYDFTNQLISSLPAQSLGNK